MEGKPLRVNLHRLTPDEHSLYDALRVKRIRVGLRFEQDPMALTGFLIVAARSAIANRGALFGAGGFVWRGDIRVGISAWAPRTTIHDYN